MNFFKLSLCFLICLSLTSCTHPKNSATNLTENISIKSDNINQQSADQDSIPIEIQSYLDDIDWREKYREMIDIYRNDRQVGTPWGMPMYFSDIDRDNSYELIAKIGSYSEGNDLLYIFDYDSSEIKYEGVINGGSTITDTFDDIQKYISDLYDNIISIYYDEENSKYNLLSCVKYSSGGIYGYTIYFSSRDDSDIYHSEPIGSIYSETSNYSPPYNWKYTLGDTDAQTVSKEDFIENYHSILAPYVWVYSQKTIETRLYSDVFLTDIQVNDTEYQEMIFSLKNDIIEKLLNQQSNYIIGQEYIIELSTVNENIPLPINENHKNAKDFFKSSENLSEWSVSADNIYELYKNTIASDELMENTSDMYDAVKDLDGDGEQEYIVASRFAFSDTTDSLIIFDRSPDDSLYAAYDSLKDENIIWYDFQHITGHFSSCPTDSLKKLDAALFEPEYGGVWLSDDNTFYTARWSNNTIHNICYKIQYNGTDFVLTKLSDVGWKASIIYENEEPTNSCRITYTDFNDEELFEKFDEAENFIKSGQKFFNDGNGNFLNENGQTPSQFYDDSKNIFTDGFLTNYLDLYGQFYSPLSTDENKIMWFNYSCDEIQDQNEHTKLDINDLSSLQEYDSVFIGGNIRGDDISIKGNELSVTERSDEKIVLTMTVWRTHDPYYETIQNGDYIYRLEDGRLMIDGVFGGRDENNGFIVLDTPLKGTVDESISADSTPDYLTEYKYDVVFDNGKWKFDSFPVWY